MGNASSMTGAWSTSAKCQSRLEIVGQWRQRRAGLAIKGAPRKHILSFHCLQEAVCLCLSGGKKVKHEWAQVQKVCSTIREVHHTQWSSQAMCDVPWSGVKKLRSHLALFSGDRSQASASHGAGPPAAEAARHLHVITVKLLWYNLHYKKHYRPFQGCKQ